MNILQIISGRNINGALTYCKFLSEHLAEQGHRVTIACRDGAWIQEVGVAGASFVNTELQRRPFELARMSNWIREHQIDLMHTHMTRAHGFGVLMKTITGVPVIATAHNRSWQLHWKFNDYVIANSVATYDYQRKVNRVRADRMEQVYCFSRLDRFSTVTPSDMRRANRQMKRQSDEFLLGCVGEVTQRKGQLHLIKALPKIIERVPNLRLILLGRSNPFGGYTKNLQQLIAHHRLENHVRWLGLRNNVEDYLSALDLTVVPSLEEPLGLVALESLAAGTPVIASHTGGLPEIIDHGKTGLLVPSADPAALENAIVRLAESAKTRQRMGEAGRAMVSERFDPTSLANDVEAIYQRVIQSRAVKKLAAA